MVLGREGGGGFGRWGGMARGGGKEMEVPVSVKSPSSSSSKGPGCWRARSWSSTSSRCTITAGRRV